MTVNSRSISVVAFSGELNAGYVKSMRFAAAFVVSVGARRNVSAGPNLAVPAAGLATPPVGSNDVTSPATKIGSGRKSETTMPPVLEIGSVYRRRNVTRSPGATRGVAGTAVLPLIE